MKTDKITYERRTIHKIGFEINGVFNSMEAAVENAEHFEQDVLENMPDEYTEVIQLLGDEPVLTIYFK